MKKKPSTFTTPDYIAAKIDLASLKGSPALPTKYLSRFSVTKEKVGTSSSGRYFGEIGVKRITLIIKSYKRTGSCHRVVDARKSYKIPNISKSVTRT